jgi:hypothetical protein
MKRNGEPGRSHLIVVIALTLVAALAGTALAGGTATTSVSKKKVKKIANKQINKRAPGLSVANAENADEADNADTVDGHHAVCPDGTFLHAGACFETTARFPSSDWTGGALSCADSAGYLPSTTELMSIRNEPGVNLGGAGAGTWSDSRFQDDAVNRAVTVLDNGTVEVPTSVANFRQIRCAFKLVR